jgi:uncharacterized protein YutE (UPF0331/DUF86 family)
MCGLRNHACLRRVLEALVDLGRHIAAKGFGRGITEYKEIGAALKEEGIFDDKAYREESILIIRVIPL